MARNLLVTLANAGYVDMARQLFSSAWFDGGWRDDMVLLTDELPAADREWFEERGIGVDRREPFLCPGEWETLWRHDRFGPIVALRHWLFDDPYRGWETIVYLDADIIVRGSLRGLTAIRRFGAIAEMGVPLADQFASRANALRYARRTGLPEFDLWRPSFNSGVFSFRPEEMDRGIVERTRALLRQTLPLAAYPEQLTMNLLFRQSWESLPDLFNFCPRLVYAGGRIAPPTLIRTGSARAGVIHFCGHEKPWHVACDFHRIWCRNLERAVDIGRDEKTPVPGTAHGLSFRLRLVRGWRTAYRRIRVAAKALVNR